MANSFEIIRYKQKLISSIVNQDTIINLIDSDYIGIGDELIYNNIFPYMRVPHTEEEKLTYITMRVDVPNISSSRKTLKDILITISVVTHQDLMKVENGGGTRTDLLGAEIDNLFNGSDEFGIGQLELKSNFEENVDYKHRCRTLKFVVTDINRSLCGD